LAVTHQGGAETFFNAQFWAGSIPLSVALLYNGALYTSRAQITVHVADDPSVKATAETSSGTAVFNNLPYRTIIVQALGGDNLIGQAGTAGEASVSVNLIGFNTPSDIDNNDFSRGLDGWNFDPLVQSAGGVVVTNHVELAGPCQVSCERRLAESIEDFDLAVTTYGLGANTVSRTFVANTGKMVQVRFRFVTSEVPGGWYGTEFNDFYAVSIRSVQGGLHIFETNSMNGLGLEAFDFESGSTNWRLLMLPVDTGDTVQVDVTVANVQDGLFDSSVYDDFIDVVDCGTLMESTGIVFPDGEKLLNEISNIPSTTYEIGKAIFYQAKEVANASALEGAQNGPQEAFLHCVWSCRMVEEIGHDSALLVGGFYDFCTSRDQVNEMQMNLENNRVGREIARTLSVDGDCRARCLDFWERGSLYCLVPPSGYQCICPPVVSGENLGCSPLDVGDQVMEKAQAAGIHETVGLDSPMTIDAPDGSSYEVRADITLTERGVVSLAAVRNVVKEVTCQGSTAFVTFVGETQKSAEELFPKGSLLIINQNLFGECTFEGDLEIINRRGDGYLFIESVTWVPPLFQISGTPGTFSDMFATGTEFSMRRVLGPDRRLSQVNIPFELLKLEPVPFFEASLDGNVLVEIAEDSRGLVKLGDGEVGYPMSVSYRLEAIAELTLKMKATSKNILPEKTWPIINPYPLAVPAPLGAVLGITTKLAKLVLPDFNPPGLFLDLEAVLGCELSLSVPLEPTFKATYTSARTFSLILKNRKPFFEYEVTPKQGADSFNLEPLNFNPPLGTPTAEIGVFGGIRPGIRLEGGLFTAALTVDVGAQLTTKYALSSSHFSALPAPLGVLPVQISCDVCHKLQITADARIKDLTVRSKYPKSLSFTGIMSKPEFEYGKYDIPIPEVQLIILNVCLIPSTSEECGNPFACIQDCAFSSGSSSSVEYILTPDQLWKGGALWSNDAVDLGCSFDLEFEAYFGTRDAGADGIMFVLQTKGLKAIGGTYGHYLAYGSKDDPTLAISPSFGVEFDTFYYADRGDIPQDHVAMVANGAITSPLVPAVPAKPPNGNLEDNAYHMIHISWDHNSKAIEVAVDGTEVLSHNVDLVTTIGSSSAFWGFTSATGDSSNQHRVRLAQGTAMTKIC
jgi:hypothetical protein